MIANNISHYLVVFITVWETVTAVQYCLNYDKRICFPCDVNKDSLTYCDKISASMKYLFLPSNLTMDYDQYSNSSIRIIEQRHTLTFYPCQYDLSVSPYLQVDPHSFYPIGSTLNLSRPQLPKLNSIKHVNKIQACLETYCSGTKNNQFRCFQPFSANSRFSFNDIVTTDCVQNISSAYIWSRKILKIRNNYFLLNAYNLIHLTLDLDNLKWLRCNDFKRLKHLRLVEIRFHSSLLARTNNYTCIFQYNPKLVLVDINGQWIWNPCNVRGFHHLNKNSPAIYAILCLLIFIGLAGCVCFYNKYRNSIRVVDSLDMEMCRIHSAHCYS